MSQVLEAPVRNWSCPSCNLTDRTQQAGPHTRMHSCPSFAGLTAPMVEVKNIDDRPDARHLLLEREDYCGDRWTPPYMAVHTDHGDGSNDRTVFAPTAHFDFAAAGAGTPMIGGPGGGVCVTPGFAGVGTRNFRQHNFKDPILARAAAMARKVDATMAWSTSAVFAFAVLQLCNKAGQTLNTDSYKVALYQSNSMTPDRTVTTAALTEYNGAASQWVTGNEVSGTGYSGGGVAVSSPTCLQASNVITFTSAGTPQWTGATFTAYGGLVYDTTVSSEGLSFNYFGGAQTVTAGTFSIAWNSSGIATFTC